MSERVKQKIEVDELRPRPQKIASAWLRSSMQYMSIIDSLEPSKKQKK